MARAKDAEHAIRLTGSAPSASSRKPSRRACSSPGVCWKRSTFPRTSPIQRVADIRALELRGLWQASKAQIKAAKKRERLDPSPKGEG